MAAERIVVGMAERRARLPVYDLLDLRLSGIHVEEAAALYESCFGRVSTRDLRPSQLVFSSELGPSPTSIAVQKVYSFLIALVGMVLTLLVPLRTLCKLEDIVTTRHVELMCKVILATGSIVGYAYGMEFFIAWYGGNPYELAAFKNRAFGPYWWSYWWMISCNVISPHLFWFKWCRTNMVFVFIVSIFVNIGMWFERFVIIVTSLHRDYIPSSWGYFRPTWVDVCTFIGSFGLFMTLFLLFMRYLPMIAISEVKAVTPQADPHHPQGGAKHDGGHR